MQSKKGFSLPLVLGIMLFATIVGTSLNRVLSKEGFTSGAQMNQSEAFLAAKAGLSSARSWITYHAVDVKALLDKFEADRVATGAAVPVYLDFLDGYTGMTYKVYLVDMMYSSSNGGNLDIKVQSVGLGRNGSNEVLTGVYRVTGIVPMSQPTGSYTPGSLPVEDALYIGGSFNNIDEPVYIDGSMYVDDAMHGNGTGDLTVNGDLVLGPGATWSYNGSLDVLRDFYMGKGDFVTNTGESIRIRGNAYFDSLARIHKVPQLMTIDGDLVALGGINTINQTGPYLRVKGDAHFEKTVHLQDGGTIQVDGDLRLGPSASLSRQNSFTFTALGNVNSYGAINFGTAISLGNSAADTAFIKQSDAAVNGSGGSKVWDDQAITAWTRLVGKTPPDTNDTSLAYIDTLKTIRDNLKKNSGKKVDPPFYPDSLLANDIPYSQLGTYISGCGAAGSDFSAKKMNCYFANAPDSVLLQGFLPVNLSGLSFNTDPDTLLKGKFMFTQINSPVNNRWPGSTSDSRVLAWLESPSQFGMKNTTDTLYGIVYSQSDALWGANVNLKGAVVLTNNKNLQLNSGGSASFIYDSDVVGEIWSVVGDSTYTGGGGWGSPTTITVFDVLSPRLEVHMLSEYPGEVLVDTTNLSLPNPTILFSPPVVRVNKGYAGSLTQLMNEFSVDTIPALGARLDICSPAPKAGAFWNFDSVATFPIPFEANCTGALTNRVTYFTVIVDTSNVQTGNGRVHFTHSSIEVPDFDSVYTLSHLRLSTGTALMEEGTVTLTLKLPTAGGNSAQTPEDFIISPLTFTLPVGTTDRDLPLTLKVIKNNLPNETKYFDLIISVTGDKMSVGTYDSMRVKIMETTFEHNVLTWVEGTYPNGQLVPENPSVPDSITSDPTHKFGYKGNSTVELKVIPDVGYKLSKIEGCINDMALDSGWTDICQVLMDDDHTVTTYFAKKQSYLKITPWPLTGAMVTVDGTYMTADNVRSFEWGTSHSVNVIPDSLGTPPYIFAGWTGDYSGSTRPLSVTMDKDTVYLTPIVSPQTFNCFYEEFDFTLSSTDWLTTRLDASGSAKTFGATGTGAIRASTGLGAATALLRNLEVGVNGSIETKLQLDGDTAATEGVVFRHTAENSWYFIGVRPGLPGQNHIQFCEDSKTNCQWAANNYFTVNKEITLKVVLQGNRYEVYIDGVLRASFKDDSHTTGHLGIASLGSYPLARYTYLRWTEASGCGANAIPEITNCRLETSTGAPADTPAYMVPGQQVYLKADIKDPDLYAGDSLYYTVVSSDGFSQESRSVADSQSIVVLTGTHTQPGQYTISLNVHDRLGAEANCTRYFQVGSATNQVPVLDKVNINGVAWTGIDTVNVNTAVTLYAAATDPDGDLVTYLWSGDMASATATGVNSTITRTFTVGGLHNIQLELRDDKGGSLSKTFTLYVKGASNQKPVISSCTATPNSGSTPLDVELTAIASDPDGGALTYTWSGAADGTGATFKTTLNTEANHQFVVTVKDPGGATATCDVMVSTNQGNAPPTGVTCAADVTSGNEPLKVKFSGTGTDASGSGVVQYRWTGSAGDVWGTPTYVKTFMAGTYTVGMSAVDGKGNVTQCSTPIVITVEHPNTAPSCVVDASSTNPTWVESGTGGYGTASLQVSYTVTPSDVNADDLGSLQVVSWTRSDGTSGTGAPPIATFNPASNTTYTTTVTVRDQHGLTGTCNSAVTANVNAAPTNVSCTATPSQATAPADIAWKASTASDGDMPLTYEWSGTATGTGGAGATVTTTGHAAGTYVSTLKVTDGNLATPKYTTASCTTSIGSLVPTLPYDFEAGVTTGWSAENSVAIETTIKRGTKSLKGITNNGWKQITANPTPSNWTGYDSLVMWVYSPAGTRNVQIYWQTGSGYTWQNSGSYSVNATWKRLSWALPSGGTKSDVRAFGLNIESSGTYYIDDVSIIKANPVGTCSITPSSTASTTGTTTVSASWTGATSVEYSFNNKSSWQSSATSPTLSTGLHVVYSRGINESGSTEASCGTFTVGSVSLCDNPTTITGGGSLSVGTDGKCYRYATSDVKGKLMNVSNGSSNYDGKFIWYGVTSEGATDCSNRIQSLVGNGTQVNNIGVGKKSDGYIYFILKANTGTYTANVSINTWNNGTGCTSSPYPVP